MEEYDKPVLIADLTGKGKDFALAVYNKLKEKNPNFELNEIQIKTFRDNEVKVKIKDNVRRKNCFFLHDSNKNPASWFLELAFVNEALHNSSAAEINDILPYLKFSRQDRKDESRVAVNSKVVANVVSKYASRIITADVHLPQIMCFYDIPTDNLYSFTTVAFYLKEKHSDFLKNLAVVSPDAGGADRAKAFRKKLRKLGIDCALVVGSKERPEEGEVGELMVSEGIKGKNVLIVDDIIDSGNSLIKLSKRLREKEVNKIYAYCTHALFTEGVEKITNEVDLMLVSDTLLVPKHEKIEVVSLADLFAEAIYRIEKGLSLSELFE